MEGFRDPTKFDPDRMMPERQEDIKFGEHYLTFGVGPHYCVGRDYAVNHLQAFLSILCTSADWDRKMTKNSERTLYLPTVYPYDSFVTFRELKN